MIFQSISSDIKISVEEEKALDRGWKTLFQRTQLHHGSSPARGTELIRQRFEPAQGHL